MAKAGGCCQSHEISYFFQILGDANGFFFIYFSYFPFQIPLISRWGMENPSGKGAKGQVRVLFLVLCLSSCPLPPSVFPKR